MNKRETVELVGAYAAMAGAVALLHVTVGRKWARYEFARRALSWPVVFVPLLILAAAGRGGLDLRTLVVALLGGAGCGGVLGAFHIGEKLLTTQYLMAEMGGHDGHAGHKQ